MQTHRRWSCLGVKEDAWLLFLVYLCADITRCPKLYRMQDSDCYIKLEDGMNDVVFWPIHGIRASKAGGEKKRDELWGGKRNEQRYCEEINSEDHKLIHKETEEKGYKVDPIEQTLPQTHIANLREPRREHTLKRSGETGICEGAKASSSRSSLIKPV